MYQVTVTPQFLSGKDTFRQAVPALSWAVLINEYKKEIH